MIRYKVMGGKEKKVNDENDNVIFHRSVGLSRQLLYNK